MTTRRTPRAILTLAVLLLPVLGAACGGGSGGSDGGATGAAPGTVTVVDNKFEPNKLEIAVGDTVTWEFQGSAQHNVTGRGLTSGNKKKGQTFERTFNSAGTFSYVCTLHPGMKGTITVS